MAKETLSKISIIISAIAALFAWQANDLSHKANLTSEKANLLAQQANGLTAEAIDIDRDVLEKDRKMVSYSIVESSLKSYEQGTSRVVMDKIMTDVKVDQLPNLLHFIDIFEGLGDDYCKGLVYENDMETKIMFDIYHVCRNQQIFENFAGKKNGIAILCAELQPKSLFASTLETARINGCVFRGSKRFNN